jgi:Helix-turn-helix domain
VTNGGRPGRPEGPLDPAAGAVANLAARLRQLREDAGRPSYRQLSRTAHYSHSALSQAAAGRVLPSLAVTLAFAQACGGDRQEWTALWHEAAAEAGVMAEPGGHAPSAGLTSAAGPTPAAGLTTGSRPSMARRGIRARLALVGRGGWSLLAGVGLVGALVWWGLPALVTAPPATRVIGGLGAPVADGDYPSVADCSSWTRDLVIRQILAANGQRLGELRLRYSMRCAAVWARFNPDPSLSSGGTVMIVLEVSRHPDGRTITSRPPYVPGHLQRSDILLLHGGCAQASVMVTRPGRDPVSVVTGCQPPP